ncbi:MAG: hypothetical protein QW512_06190 [Thermofilaceae archaeon]
MIPASVVEAALRRLESYAAEAEAVGARRVRVRASLLLKRILEKEGRGLSVPGLWVSELARLLDGAELRGARSAWRVKAGEARGRSRRRNFLLLLQRLEGLEPGAEPEAGVEPAGSP